MKTPQNYGGEFAWEWSVMFSDFRTLYGLEIRMFISFLLHTTFLATFNLFYSRGSWWRTRRCLVCQNNRVKSMRQAHSQAGVSLTPMLFLHLLRRQTIMLESLDQLQKSKIKDTHFVFHPSSSRQGAYQQVFGRSTIWIARIKATILSLSVVSPRGSQISLRSVKVWTWSS